MNVLEKDEKPESLTDEEHQARAMLMGLCYHHGNGEPFYYNFGSDGIPDTISFIDAETLEPLAYRSVDDGDDHLRLTTSRARRQHNALWNDWGADALRKDKP